MPRLRRMHDVLSGYVERGELSGLVSLVERRGDLHVDAIGIEAGAIFRIASMTKPVPAAGSVPPVHQPGEVWLYNTETAASALPGAPTPPSG